MWFALSMAVGIIAAYLKLPIICVIIMCMISLYITGKAKTYFRIFWIRAALPVFILSGFVVCCNAIIIPDISFVSDKNRKGTFTGRADSVIKKADRLEIRMHKAKSKDSDIKTGIIIYSDLPAYDPELQESDGHESRKHIMDDTIENGDQIKVKGKIVYPESASDPGQFDMKKYLLTDGIRYMVYADEMTVIRKGPLYRRLLMRLSQSLKNVYESIFNDDEAGVLEAMILGDKQLLSDDVKDLYQEMGIIHIIAISGLHVSIIGRSLFKRLMKAGIPLRAASLTATFVLLSYAYMVGAGASTRRAVIMFLFAMAGEYIGRSYDMLSSMGAAAIMILIIRPLELFSAGFEFSFLAILALGYLDPLIHEKLEKGGRIPDALISKLSPSMSVTLAALPVTAACYYKIPVLSLPINLVIVPVMSILMPAGMAVGMIGLICMKAALIPASAIHVFMTLITKILEIMHKLPFSIWRTGHVPGAVIVIYYVILFLFIYFNTMTRTEDLPVKWPLFQRIRQESVKIRNLLAAVLIIAVPYSSFTSVGVFMDVGQGDGMFFRSPGGAAYLIDGGSSSEKQIGKYRIIPLMDYYAEDMIDYALVSHGDEDHISGVRELLEEKKVRNLVVTYFGRTDETLEELEVLAEKNDTNVIHISKGDTIKDGSWTFTCIYPESDKGDGVKGLDTKNDQSMVLRLDAESTSVLFTGDISGSSEQYIMDTTDRTLLNADILKTPHHGSKYSSGESFLEAVSPETAVISCALHNKYGHPDPETIKRLEHTGARICRTPETGAVIISFHKNRYDLRSFKNLMQN